MVLFEEKGFDPQALTSLTQRCVEYVISKTRFDPQALTSLTHRTLALVTPLAVGFDPQALTSLTGVAFGT